MDSYQSCTGTWVSTVNHNLAPASNTYRLCSRLPSDVCISIHTKCCGILRLVTHDMPNAEAESAGSISLPDLAPL